jgi:hypothetical protein
MAVCADNELRSGDLVMKSIIRVPALACAGVVIACASAFADTEVLLRKEIGFDQCHKSVDGILATLSATADRVFREVDTGAILRIKLVSDTADLVMVCNKVAGTIEVSRVTPGALTVAVK